MCVCVRIHCFRCEVVKCVPDGDRPGNRPQPVWGRASDIPAQGSISQEEAEPIKGKGMQGRGSLVPLDQRDLALTPGLLLTGQEGSWHLSFPLRTRGNCSPQVRGSCTDAAGG